MKLSSSGKLIIIVAVILAAIVIGMIMIRDKEVDTDITSKTTNVGLVITGARDDANFCQTHYDALTHIKEDLNLNVICSEGVTEDEACLDAMKDLIEHKRCEIIIAASYGYGEYVTKAAEAYPDVFFINPSGTEKRINMSSCFGRMYQARYLSGIVAGMKTETGEIGYVAAFPISEVIRGINAFTLGVRSVAPDVNVHVIYVNSWVDDDVAEKGSNILMERYPDIDIMSMHTNSLAPNRVAADRGIFSIGFNMDNAELFPGSLLAACEWKWDEYYKKTILDCLKGKFYGSIDWISMEDGIVGLSEPTSACAPGTKGAVERAVGGFEDRNFDVFYGPVTDNEGVLRIPEGESMSDDEMLNRFDWYVEGVSVEE
ncbi:MAG: BMP family ABC transporter substrate-binding protein [Lachnospiraceae bacterium]|nr:BMP family ABC transporter substrate-binding protein [Lachnospiraceae bacterium]